MEKTAVDPVIGDESYNLVRNLVLLSALSGAGVRGAIGVREMFSRPKHDERGLYLPSIKLPVRQAQPIIPEASPEEKVAEQAAAVSPPPSAPAGQSLGRQLWDKLPMWDSFPGFGAPDSVWGDWRTMGVGAPLALAALYGGYKLTDSFLDSRRRSTLDAELEKARQTYIEMLSNPQIKFSSDQSTPTAKAAQQLTAAAETMTKEALLENTPGAVLGTLAAIMALSGAGGFSIGHSLATKRDQQAILQKALTERAKSRYQHLTLPAQVVPSLEEEPPQRLPAA